MKTPWFFDCPQCGEIGRLSQLKEHPTRPVAMDLGFCPKCGGEVQNPSTEAEIKAVLADYGEDADAFIAALPA